MSGWWSKAADRLEFLTQLRSPGDVLLFLHIFIFAAIVPVLLRVSLPELERLLEPRKASSTPEQARTRKIVSYVDAVLRVGRPLIRPGCLIRGLTLYYFLRRAGEEVSLCFGTGNVEDEFAGHCWLVKDGMPFMEERDPQPLFVPIYSFPSRGYSPKDPGQWAQGNFRTDGKR